MVKAASEEIDVDVHVIPFPVNEPELWPAYVPPDVTQFIRHFSPWGTTKIERLRAAGYDVVILDEGAEKELSGADVRAAIRHGGDWQSLVPQGVVRIIAEAWGLNEIHTRTP
jgi:nicotinamide-nucleotide adenylyltransferase